MFDSEDSGDDSSSEETQRKVEQSKPRKVVGARHLEELRQVLDLDTFQRRKEARSRKRKARKAKKKLETGTGIIQTIASKKLGQPVAEVVTYTDYRKLKKVKAAAKDPEGQMLENLVKQVEQDIKEQGKGGMSKGKEVTLQQARFEVFKLGVSAMDKSAKEDAQTALAIRLGAKPAKEKGLPYAEFKDKQEREKEEQRLRLEEQQNAMAGVRKKAKGSQDKSKPKSKSKKKSSSGMKMGSFDGGMLKLSSKELSRMKTKK